MPGAHHQTAPSCGVGGPDAAAAHDDTLCGEIRALDVLHQIAQGGLRIVQHTNAGADDLPQIVGRNVGGHTHGNAGGAVHQQVGEPRGQHSRLPAALVKVGIPIHGILLNIPEHLVGDFGEPCLGVAVGGGGIAIHGAEVAVAVHQHIAHGEVLSQTHQGVVHGSVTVGMVSAQHIAHTGSRLLEGTVRGKVVLIHGVENAAVDGLQAVPHIGQGAAHDDGHGVLNVRLLHFRHQGRLHDVLLGIPDLLRVILRFLTHSISPCQRVASEIGFSVDCSLFASSGSCQPAAFCEGR